MDILCINCVDQVILCTTFFVTGDFIVEFVFCIWRYFNGTYRRGSFEERSAAVGQPSGGAAQRIASGAPVGRQAGRRAGEHPGADGRFSHRRKGRPGRRAGPSGNRGVGAPDGGRNAGSGRRVRSGAGLLAGSAPRTGVANRGSRGRACGRQNPSGRRLSGLAPQPAGGPIDGRRPGSSRGPRLRRGERRRYRRGDGQAWRGFYSRGFRVMLGSGSADRKNAFLPVRRVSRGACPRRERTLCRLTRRCV